MLDEVGIIHMNGRIYDAKIARFLQADPIIQDPLNSQSLNRYSYVWNNPLNATDPSGFITEESIEAGIRNFNRRTAQAKRDAEFFGSSFIASAIASKQSSLAAFSAEYASFHTSVFAQNEGSRSLCSMGYYCTNTAPGVEQANDDNKSGLQAVFNDDQLNHIATLFNDRNYAGAYQYIFDQIKGLDSVSDETKYWFEKAIEINSNAGTAANTFIRAYTAYGLNMDGIRVNPKMLQETSDSIAKRVLSGVLKVGGVSKLDTMVRADISVALKDGGQTIGGWAGAFYYWNLKYGDNGETVGELIRSDPKELTKFRESFKFATFHTSLKHPLESIGGTRDAILNDDSREAMRHLSD